MSFYRCGDAGPTDAAHGRQGVQKTVRHRTIDIHCHMSVPEAAALMKPHFKAPLEPAIHFNSPESAKVNHEQSERIAAHLSTAEQKLADMDRLGVDMQVLSPAPPQYYYWADPELTSTTSRMINDRIAETVAGHPDRFAGLGTLPMQNPELAVRELKRCVADLGLKGIEISSNVAGQELSDPKFRPVFAAAEELGILVFLHPLGFTHGERLNTHYLNNIIGNPLESTIAISHLIFGGVLDRHPGLKLCVAHGGGYLPAYAGRMDHAHRNRPDCQGCQHPPSTYLRRMSFDTVVFDRDQLRYLVQKFGARQIVLGSDYPFDMGDPDPVGFVAGLEDLSEEDLADILGLNAARLLGL